jgi:hypothetical protein
MSITEIIYASDHGLLIGFHGCDESTRDKVLFGKEPLHQSNNDYDWLGDGMYFWQNNYDRAWNFAANPPPDSKIKKPAVLGAVFSLGNCLDLTDKKWIDLTKYSYDNLKKSTEKEGNQLPNNINPPNNKSSGDKIIRRLDCAVIKNIHRVIELNNQNRYKKRAIIPPFESVRGVFFEGDPLYQDAGFRDKTHIQICIRNPNLIKGFFLPRTEILWPSK